MGDEVLVVFDAEDGAATRAQADASYKANRTEADHSPIQALAPLKQILDLAGVRWLETTGTEGDDVLATIAMRASAAGRPVVVLSGDRDLYSLLADPGVRILNPQAPPERQFITADTVLERYGVSADQWADFRALTGDPADNLPGVPGIGPVTAARLLAGGRRLEDLPLTTPGRLAKPLARTRACWDDVMRWRSLHRLNIALTCPNLLTGTATDELPAPAALMKGAGLW
ncbi:5'-3' exonuclease H3TH domain-containing protein [Streptomyces sp. NPDC048357]|uniref:5'-3' exonuclease H3TH domain-containing protein n=1 Tax=Streptomyces sp. NPDC048357 TaxID=3154719 RepID=UPI0034234B06